MVTKTKTKRRGPLLGAHMSIAGGVGNALLDGKKVDCDAIQIFTKSSRQWAAKPYTKEEIAQFHAVKAAFDPEGLLNPGKGVPLLARCAEYGAMRVKGGALPHPDLPRF